MADPKYQHVGDIDQRLIEECAELIEANARLIKAICKAERFGYDNFYPQWPEGSEENNKTDILKEIKDVRRLLKEMEEFLKDR